MEIERAPTTNFGSSCWQNHRLQVFAACLCFETGKAPPIFSQSQQVVERPLFPGRCSDAWLATWFGCVSKKTSRALHLLPCARLHYVTPDTCSAGCQPGPLKRKKEKTDLFWDIFYSHGTDKMTGALKSAQWVIQFIRLNRNLKHFSTNWRTSVKVSTSCRLEFKPEEMQHSAFTRFSRLEASSWNANRVKSCGGDG